MSACVRALRMARIFLGFRFRFSLTCARSDVGRRQILIGRPDARLSYTEWEGEQEKGQMDNSPPVKTTISRPIRHERLVNGQRTARRARRGGENAGNGAAR